MMSQITPQIGLKSSSAGKGLSYCHLFLQNQGDEMTGGYLSDLMTITSTDSVDSEEENKDRGNWRTRLEFILSCLGYVVGLGNIWRFPYLVYRNGGGAFFIPYLVMLTFCGIPLVYMEMAFGQYASLGPITIWKAVPLFKGVGYAMVLTSIIVSVYYNVINAWAFHFLLTSFFSTLPWSTCDNSWNTDNCSENKFWISDCSWVNSTYIHHAKFTNTTCREILQDCASDNQTQEFDISNVSQCLHVLQDLFGSEAFINGKGRSLSLTSPSEEYYYNSVLNQSSGLDNLGKVQWQLALYLLLCWFIVFICLVRGIYSSGKVAYFVVIIPFMMLIMLLVCSMLVEGHLDGIKFYVTPKWDQLLDGNVWSDAAGQVFFSLSACAGGLTTLSSYNKFHNNIYRDAILICLIDTLVSVLAGFTVFATLGILGNQLNTTVENVIDSNVGLVFVAFPAAVTNFQPASMWSVFFFLMILLMGLSSQLTIVETIVTAVIDEKVKVLRKWRILVLLCVCCVLYLLGLPFTTQGGIYLLQLVDHYGGSYPPIFNGIFMCLAIAWVYRVRHFCTDIRHMIGTAVSWWWRVMWCVVTPLIILFQLVFAIVGYKPLSDKVNHNQFPAWSEGLGISLVVIILSTIPAFMVIKIVRQEGTFMQRLKQACTPKDNWGPAQLKHWKNVEYYPAVNTHTLSVDMEQSPLHTVADHIDFSTKVRIPSLSQASLLPQSLQRSPKKPQDMRQKAILNHAYSNPQCSVSTASIDKLSRIPSKKLRNSLTSCHGDDGVIAVPKASVAVESVDVSTQTYSSYFKSIRRSCSKQQTGQNSEYSIKTKCKSDQTLTTVTETPGSQFNKNVKTVHNSEPNLDMYHSSLCVADQSCSAVQDIGATCNCDTTKDSRPTFSCGSGENVLELGHDINCCGNIGNGFKQPYSNNCAAQCSYDIPCRNQEETIHKIDYVQSTSGTGSSRCKTTVQSRNNSELLSDTNITRTAMTKQDQQHSDDVKTFHRKSDAECCTEPILHNADFQCSFTDISNRNRTCSEHVGSDPVISMATENASAEEGTVQLSQPNTAVLEVEITKF